MATARLRSPRHRAPRLALPLALALVACGPAGGSQGSAPADATESGPGDGDPSGDGDPEGDGDPFDPFGPSDLNPDELPEPDPDQWVKIWGSMYDGDVADAIAIASTREVYVVGDNSEYGHFIKSYTPEGASQVEAGFGQPDVGSRTFAIAALPGDALRVGGTFYNNQRYEGFLLATDSLAAQQWVVPMGAGQETAVTGIAQLPGGDVVIAGWTSGVLHSQPFVGERDVFVARYTQAGERVWTRTFGTGPTDMASAVAVTSTGVVFVTGGTWGSFPDQTNAGSADVFLARLDPDGALLGLEQWGGSGGSADRGVGLVTDDAGAAYLLSGGTGSLAGGTPVGERDVSVVKLDDAGNWMWSTQWGTPERDDPYAIALDGEGNILVTGNTNGDLAEPNGGYADVFLTSISPTGAVLASAQWPSPNDEWARAIAVDPAGGIYIAGSVRGEFLGEPSQGEDAFLLKVSGDASFPPG